jgi:hypothetical protein
VSHFTWEEEERFDEERMEYRIKTQDGNCFVMDVRTGEIVSQSRDARDQDVSGEGPDLQLPPIVHASHAVAWFVAALFGVFLSTLFVWMVVMRRLAANRRRRFLDAVRGKSDGPDDHTDPHAEAIITKSEELQRQRRTPGA